MVSTRRTHRLNYNFGMSYDTVCSLAGDGTSMGHKIHRPHLSTARDARAVRTRESLRRALLRLLDLKPLEQITIRDVCGVADVGYTTFFRHHPTKESLLNDVAAEQIGRLVGLALSVLDTSDTRSASLALCTYVDEHRKLWSTLLTGGAAGAMRDEFMRLSRQIAATRARPGIWPPADIATILVVSSTIELLSWWLRDRRPMTTEQVAEILELVIITPAVNIEPITAGRGARRAKGR
jgi:AcrR family transcriptional regulator